MQTYLTQQIAKQVSDNLDAKFEVGRVDIVFFNRLLLRDIHIEDQLGDTLLQADRLIASIQYLNRVRKDIFFNQIVMHNARINFRTDADSVLNLQFIINALKSDDNTKTKWNFAINSIHLRDSRFSYRRYNPKPKEYGINFQDIEISNLNLLANKIHTTPDSVHFNIRYLNFKESSGFLLNHFTSENTISRSGINVSNLQVVTPGSRLDLEHYIMNYDAPDAFKDFVNRVNIISHFNPSVIKFHDIAFFAPGLKDVDLEVLMSGIVSGRINNLKGDKINISGFQETSLLTSFNMVGLPDINETFIFLDLQYLISTVEDIFMIASPGLKNGGNDIPFNLTGLGELSYKGKFTGFIDDFVAYGELSSELGTLITDISLQPDSDNLLNFNGRLRAMHFDAGSLVASEQVGRITFNAGVNGQISTQKVIYAELEGIIDSIFLFDYNYRHIQLSGELADRKFEGSASIEDPNIVLQFLGSFDLSEEIPVFDFSAKVSNARLYDLKIEKDNPDLMLSFYSKANFQGNSIDNINGKISLADAVFEKEDHILNIDNIALEAKGTGNQRQIILNSSLADVEIAGNYEFATLTKSFNQFIYNYIPSYVEHTVNTSVITGNSFSFNIHLKDLSGLTEFFTPEFSIASGTKIDGTYDPYAYVSKISGASEKLKIKNHTFRNISLETQSDDSVFNIKSRIEHTLVDNRFEIENLTMNSGIRNDSISFMADWDNKKKLSYKGDLISSINFEKIPGKKEPRINIDIFPSKIIIADSAWYVSQSRISLDSTSYQFENFIFGQTDQYFKVDGKLSHNPDDSLHLEFRRMNLENIGLITTISNFQIAGTLTGTASLSDIHKNPVFVTDLGISELFLNDQDFGNMSIISQWNNIDKSISIHTFSNRDSDRIINIEGSYMPEGDLLDFDIELNNINLRTFDGYLDEVFGNLRGNASGKLKLNGKLAQPLFNGNILLERTSFMIDFLKTNYNFTHDVTIKNNDIFFDNLLVYDPNNNTCRANGSVSSNYFRNFKLNIYLYPDRFMALNTIERDNEPFYGQVIASGLVHISGPTNNIMMNISARTERNTRFFIPLKKSSEVGELHFLNFINDTEQSIDQENDLGRYEVDLSGLQLNFDLDVTPDAEVQIVFDSKIGDIIRGRGRGSFKMGINPQGQFNMFGEYTIEQGDYLFTLQNVINKRFEIEREGTISWNGDPFDANIDMRAVYRLRAPLNTLMAPFSNGTNDMYTRRIPVECQIIMKGKLMAPAISFDIDLPTADSDTRRNVQGILNNQEKRNRQFLSLLIINNFLPEQDFAGPGRVSSLGMSATEASITTVSEFFSNQLSNWLSQLSRDVDFGVNWRPGDEITPDEVELALSTQLLNDRVSINGHVDVGGRQTNTSNIVGDFDVDIKLNRSGKLRLKAFTRANDNLIRPHLSPYTQGVGLFYREEFDSFDELLTRYWNMVFSAN